MRKHIISVIIAAIFLFMLSVPVEGADEAFQERVWQAIESFKSRGPVNREEFVDIDTKKVRFPHRKHQILIKELNKSCEVCHHRREKGQTPRACRRCHSRRKVVSQGKYAPAGKRLNQKDIFHLLCGDCHKKMLQSGYKKNHDPPAKIPSKCHHCHVRKDK